MTTPDNQYNQYNQDNLPAAPQEQSGNLPQETVLPQELTPLTDGEVAALNQYTDPGALIRRLYTYNWNPDMELEEVIRMAKQDESLGVKMRAITFLRKLVTDSMTQSGMIATLTQSRKADGVNTTLSTKVVASALPYYKQTHQNNLNAIISQKGDPNALLAEIPGNLEEIPEPSNEPTEPTEPKEPESTVIGDHKPPTADSGGQFPGISVPTDPSDTSDPAGYGETTGNQE